MQQGLLSVQAHLEGNAAALAKAGGHGVQGVSNHSNAAVAKVLARLEPPARPDSHHSLLRSFQSERTPTIMVICAILI